MSSRSRGPGVLKRLILALVTAGVVVGFWRWAGQGADVTDPGWLRRTTETVASFGEVTKDWVGQLGAHLG
ncbi:hypothetical protein [Streptomyces sp. NPDC054865]